MSTHTSTNPNMVDTLLFEQFATLATSRDGIGRLRELILQLAVQGKLGTQNFADEPASVLLERIQKEKEQLVKEGIIKKDKLLESVTDCDVVFQIPKNWVLTRLGNIAQYNGEIKTAANEISEDAWVLDLEDIEKDTSRILQKLRFSDRQSLSTKSRFQKGDILYGKLRPYLNKVVVADEDGYCTTEIVPIRPYGKILSKYLMYALKTPDFLSYVNSKTYGIKMPRLGTVDALNTIIPLPPLAEQHRIVAKVDRLMALCDELEARQQQERAGCLELGTASFAGLQNAESPEEFGRQWAQVCDAFDLILDCPENVAVLRQTILQLAVQGKLGTQDVEDEPARNLLERMNVQRKDASKLKYERSFPLKENHLHKVPDNWIQTQVKLVGSVQIGRQRAPKHHIGPNMRPYLRVANVYEDKIDTSNVLQMNFTPEEFESFQLRYGDILLNEGQSQELVGRPAIFRDEISNICFQNTLVRFRAFEGLVKEYALLVFRSFLHGGNFLQISKRTTNIAHLGTERFANMSFPLPPLAEQHRIVAKVDALMALCDQLEAQLKERAGMQGKFTDAVVKSIGTG